LDLSKNTIVIFTADHGWMCGEKNLWCKGVLYEEAIKIPLFVRMPPNADGMYNGDVIAQTLVSNIDLTPTLSEAVLGPTWVKNFRHPNGRGFEGKSLMPALKDPSVIINQFVFSSYGSCQPPNQVRTNSCTSDDVPNSCDRPPITHMSHTIIKNTATQTWQYTAWWAFNEVRLAPPYDCSRPYMPNAPTKLNGYGYISPQIDLDQSFTDFTHRMQEVMYSYAKDAKYGAGDHPNVNNLALRPNAQQANQMATLRAEVERYFPRLAM
jgi:hypothetical protein